MNRVLLNKLPHLSSRVPQFQSARRLSSHAPIHLKQNRNTSVAVAAALGGAALVSAYFFWPDNSRSAPTYEHAKLSPTHFTPVTVTASEPTTKPNARLVTLSVPRQSLPETQDASFSPIWSIFIKDDDIQVERPYTPLEGVDEQGNMKFWIKRYPKGEVGRWILSKAVGDQIEIRGPVRTWPWQEEQWDEIIMVCCTFSNWHRRKFI